MDTVNAFLNRYPGVKRTPFGILPIPRPRMECKDGFTISVQAGHGLYSLPADSNALSYTCVECGFPDSAEEELLPYAEDKDSPLHTVYAYVPVKTVVKIIEKHGGLKGKE